MEVHVHLKVTKENENGIVLYDEVFKFPDLKRKNGNVHTANENKMLKKIRETKKEVEETYPNGYLVCNFQNVKT